MLGSLYLSLVAFNLHRNTLHDFMSLLCLLLWWQSSSSSHLTPCLCFLFSTHLHRCGTRNIRRGRYDPGYQSWHQDNNLTLVFIMIGWCHPFYKSPLFSTCLFLCPYFVLVFLFFFFFTYTRACSTPPLLFHDLYFSYILAAFSITSEQSLFCVDGHFITVSIKRVYCSFFSPFLSLFALHLQQYLIRLFFATRNSSVHA